MSKRLFVGDGWNTHNRVLIFDTNTITNGEDAINVLGQPNFTTSNTTPDQATIGFNTGLEYDTVSDNLFVTDSTNNRIMIFDAAATAEPPVVVPEFSTYMFILILLIGSSLIMKTKTDQLQRHYFDANRCNHCEFFRRKRYCHVCH